MDVIVSPIDVKPGAAVRFYGLVENRGEGDASSTETVFNVYEEGSPGNWAKIVSTSETTDAIDLYSSTFVASSYTWTAPPEPLFSRYKFEMCVDGNNSVVELDENNNCAEVELPNTSVAVAKVESAGASGTVRSISSPSQDEISCAPTCSRSYSFFTTLQLLAEPDEGSVFGGWGEACEAFGYDERCLLEMDRDKAVLAWFEKLLYGDLDRNGVVSVTDALTALAIAVGQMSPTDYQLLAGDVNLDGNIFVTDVLLILSASLGSVQLPQATLSNLTIQVTKSGNGMGELVSKKYGIFEPGFCGFDCGPVELWKEGQKVVIRPRPDPGSILVGWRGVCAGTGKNCRVRVKNISEAEVVFEEPSPTTPDLVVESLRLSPRVGKMKAGKNLRVTAKIKNIGDVPSLPFEVTLRVDVDDNGFGDGNDIEEFLTIPSSLAKNRRILRRWRNVWVITPGIHQVEVCADSDGAVAELHEDNDCNYTTIFVPAN